jgi:hypothetical protein
MVDKPLDSVDVTLERYRQVQEKTLRLASCRQCVEISLWQTEIRDGYPKVKLLLTCLKLLKEKKNP